MIMEEASEVAKLPEYFGRFISGLAGNGEDWLAALAKKLLAALEEGHICLPYEDWSALVENMRGNAFPSREAAREFLLETTVIGEDPLSGQPMVLSPSDRLYLARYRHYELLLVDKLRALAFANEEAELSKRGREVVMALFQGLDPDRTGGQREAVLKGLQRRLTLISGGPGTGKTSTVARLLAACIQLKEPQYRLSIALAAPTGKAATRLQEAVANFLQANGISETERNYSLGAAQTVHRLLGARSDSIFFRYDEKNPLPYDLVVVDETSMLDVPLMAKLLQAIDPGRTRLVLLGDHDQLTSVQAGSLFGDLVEAARLQESPLNPCCQRLRETFRFGASSGIGRFVQAMQNEQIGEAEEILFSTKWEDIQFIEWKEVSSFTSWVEEAARGYIERLSASSSVDRVVEALGAFRLLTALRQGLHGSDAVNSLLRQKFNPTGGRQSYYHGMPVQILQNDYGVKLFNGDTGVLWEDERGERLTALFPLPGEGHKMFSLARLPRWESAYAMTIHRSQGSEFDEVVLVFPPEDNPLLTRELVYTGVSRARNKVCILGSKEVLRKVLRRKVKRVSGIVEEMNNGLGFNFF